jgi:acyl-CoA reductase-like NAD-dependent aldehyde dehydrogenase
MPPSIEFRNWPIHIGDKVVGSNSSRVIGLPYDGTPVAEVPQFDPAMLDRAIGVASEARAVMAAMAQHERSTLLFKALALLERDLEEFARLIALETGKPIKEARGEARRATETLRASAVAARELRGEVIAMDAAPAGRGYHAFTVREPVGVVGAITPFNFPLNLSLHKIGPALAGGNTVVHKPSENTPLTALRLARLFGEAGAPTGAYNVVTGDGETIGAALVSHPLVQMITFTGSVAAGKEIRAKAGLKRVTLELGGNAAMVVEPDADVRYAAERAVVGGFSLSGQSCISVQRIYVHQDVRDEFLHLLCDRAQKLKIGHPLEEDTDISSLINEEAAQRVESWIGEAVAAGAKQALGGPRQRATVPPTVLIDVPETTRIACDEVFGPVVIVDRYRELEHAMQQANATRYGLQHAIFTRDLQKALTVSRRLHAGGIMINEIPGFRVDHMPYGGVKESGIGREGPRYAIEEMTEPKLICWKA